MARTIKDMAIEAYPISKNGAFKQSQMEYEIEIKQKRSAYFNGANAVLEKVTYLVDKIDVDNHSDEDLEDLYDYLCEMIKNLKG